MVRYNSQTFRLIKNLLLRFPDKIAVYIMYYVVFGRGIDWAHPESLSAWINAQKVRDNDNIAPFADKIAVKSAVSEIIGEKYVTPILWSGNSPEEIPFSELQYPVIIKTSHGSGRNIMLESKNSENNEMIIQRVRKTLNRRHGIYLRERFYDRIDPKILIEPILKDGRGKLLDDYKIHMINGELQFFQIIHDRHGNYGQCFYSLDWNRIYLNSQFQEYDGEIPKPDNFDEIVSVAKSLSRNFSYVRVDLFVCDEFIKFGEFAFMPNAGFLQMLPATMDRALLNKMGKGREGGFIRQDSSL